MTTLNPESDVAQLMAKPTKPGTVEWIGLRPERRGPLQSVQEAEAVSGSGLAGDHFHGQGDGKRQVTLIQGEHLDAVAPFCGGRLRTLHWRDATLLCAASICSVSRSGVFA